MIVSCNIPFEADGGKIKVVASVLSLGQPSVRHAQGADSDPIELVAELLDLDSSTSSASSSSSSSKIVAGRPVRGKDSFHYIALQTSCECALGTVRQKRHNSVPLVAVPSNDADVPCGHHMCNQPKIST